MATPKNRQTNTRKKGGARLSGKSSGKSNRGGKRVAELQQTSYVREVGAFVCLFFSVFTFLGLFGVDAVFINGVTLLAKGLIGYGFYILPFLLLLCFFTLLLHRGRPVKLPVVSAFLLAVSFGGLAHLIAAKTAFYLEVSLLKDLYLSGQEMASGGAVSGLFAVLFSKMFSTIGAYIIFIVLTLLFLLMALHMTVPSLIRAIRNRPRPEPETPQPKREEVDVATALVNHVAERHIEHVERKRAANIAEFDLPVDDPPMPERKPAAKRTPKSPADLLAEQRRDAEAAPAAEKPAEPEKPPMRTIPQLFPNPIRKEAPVSVDVPPRSAKESTPEETPPWETVRVEPEPQVTAPAAAAPAASAAGAGAVSATAAAVVAAAHDKVKPEEARQAAEEVATEIEALSGAEQQTMYAYPSTDLLNTPAVGAVDGTEEMRANTERLADTLKSFGIEAHICNVTRGPSVTRYELELDRGVKLSKVTNLADDIALSLGASGVRISAIPDKISVVGIEVPNRTVTMVPIREVIGSDAFQTHKSKTAFAIGKDISGNHIVGNIAKLPHMLIAGTTGSGKSVCMNSLIISLLYKARPDEVKLIMVDPKMVELGIYNNIPHLLIPVVTNPKKAAGALQWAVSEMMRRYRLMADAGVRDLESYNKLADHDPERERMPSVVVVIDELADLMLVAAKEVEESICRVAQMGRASGMHLVIATQRPSADVITGLMKANIPSRIAFAVASTLESRIILDTGGAEKLVGKGDMLYAPLGQGKPLRVQGCFITDEEVQRVVDFIKKTSSPEYNSEVMDQIEKKSAETGKGDASSDAAASEGEYNDELLPNAVEVILETGQASVSMLQRRLKLGYARAARIVDEMEERGIVGPFEGSKPRQLLITREQWEIMQNGGVPPEEAEPLPPTVEDNPPVEEELP